MSDDLPIPVFIPALVTILAFKERAKGSPLNREEVLAIRDQGVCMMMKESDAIKLDQSRGYDDIDPEFVWEQWQEIRVTLTENQDPT